MNVIPVAEGIERLLSAPYKDGAQDTDVLISQFDDLIRLRDQPAAERKRLKSLRDRLLAHRAAAQMSLFGSGGVDD